MRKSKRKYKAGPVYGKSPLPTWIFQVVIALFLWGMMLFNLTALKNTRVPTCWSCLLLCPGPLAFYITFQLWISLIANSDKQLTIKDEGIEIRFMGVESFARWDNLDQFNGAFWGNDYHWGIQVYDPIIKSRSSFSRIFHHADALDTFIPLDYFEEIPHISDKQINLEHFKKTPLGSDLYYYAPHLFGAAESKPKH